MATDTQNNLTVLRENFHFESSTHSFDIRWTSLGNPAHPTVILIHGTPWSSRVWVPIALSLSRQFHVYLFDNPGFGSSPLEQELHNTSFSPSNEVEKLDADLARQSAAFAALFKEWEKTWDGQKPHVIAHDHGGLMSLRANLLHHCHYSSLCLVDVVAIGPFGQPLFQTVAENPLHFQQLSDSAFEDVLESYIKDAAFARLSTEVMQILKEPWLASAGREGFIRQLCQASHRSTEAVESRYCEVGQKTPTKIIWGANDAWIPVETATRLGEAIGADKVVIIKDAGHLVMYDQPARLSKEVRNWLCARCSLGCA